MDWGSYAIMAAVVIGTVLGYAWWLGLVMNMKPRFKILHSCEIMYFPYVGSIDGQLGNEYECILEDIKKDEITKHAFDRSKQTTIGLYYDDPMKAKNPDELRACLGFIFDPINDNFRDHIINKWGFKHEYFYHRFVPSKTLYGSFSFKYPRMVAHIAGYHKFYKTYKKFFSRHPELKNDRISGGYLHIEVYSSSQISYYAPIQNHKNFDLLAKTGIKK